MTTGAGRASAVEFNPFAFAVHEDPYSTYRRLRDEAPAYWNDDLRFWALSRYADVQAAFRDTTTYSSAGGISLEARGRPAPFPMLITTDPPDHTALRKLVNRVFTPRRVAALEAEARRIVIGYLDRIGPRGSCDVVADLSSPFPMDVISAVLGVPEADRAELRSRADQILLRDDGSMVMPPEALEGFAALIGYFTDDIADRRRGGGGGGLIADLADAEVAGRRLADEELLGFCIMLILAGHETTTKLVANAVEVLGRHPDARRRLVAEPSLIPDAVEEVLRYHTSTQLMHRTVTTDTTIHGRTLRAGDSVLLLIGSANRDEREFGPTADRFDLDRRPDHHLAFGYGAHYCLGAGLARMEARIALEELLGRLPDHEVDHDAAVRFHSGNVTGWARLPITFPAVPAG